MYSNIPGNDVPTWLSNKNLESIVFYNGDI